MLKAIQAYFSYLLQEKKNHFINYGNKESCFPESMSLKISFPLFRSMTRFDFSTIKFRYSTVKALDKDCIPQYICFKRLPQRIPKLDDIHFPVN